jgi:hypothetical protein
LTKIQKKLTTTKSSESVILYTLNYILNNRIEVSFRNITGYLIYRNQKYIWQPKNNMDERLTMTERKYYENETLFKRFKILSAIQEVPIIPNIQEQELGKLDIDLLKNMFEIKYNLATSIINVPRDIIIDSFVDSLDQNSYQELIEYLMMNKPFKDEFANECLNSLDRAGVIFAGLYIFNHFDKSLYTKSNKVFKKCTILDIPEKVNEELVAKLENPLDINTRGYMKISKDKVVFKIRDDPMTNGFVCHNTSLLTLTNLIDFIYEHTNTKLNKRYLKSELCYIYELLKRTHPSEKFQRPYFIKI